MVPERFSGRIFPTKDATKRGTTASSDEKRQGLSSAKNRMCIRGRYPMCSQVFNSLNQFWLGATFFFFINHRILLI